MRDQPHAPSHASDATPDMAAFREYLAQKRPCEPREVKKERCHLFAVWHHSHHHHHRSTKPCIAILFQPSYRSPCPSEVLPTNTNGGEKLLLVRWSPRWKDSLACLLACLQGLPAFARNSEPFSCYSHTLPYITAERRVKDACCMLQKRKQRDTQAGDTMPTSSTPLFPETGKYPLPAGTLVLLPSPCLGFPSIQPPFPGLPQLSCPTTSVVSRLQIQFGLLGASAAIPILAYMKQGRSNEREVVPGGGRGCR